MAAALERARPGAADSLANHTLQHLSTWDDIAVRAVPESQTNVGCSVAGAYLASLTPPVLAVADSLSAGRRAFTALHELGHHLQQTDTSLMTALLAEPEGGQALEDAACDAFAAQVLLPDRLVDDHLPVGATAAGVAALWQASSASRAASCVRAAQRLTTPGHVLLLDETGHVMFAAAHELPPVARRSNQGHIPVVADAMSRPGRRAHGRTRVQYRDGILGQELYVQVADIGGYLVVVAVTERAPWETTFHLPLRDDGPTGRDWTCEQCGHDFTTFVPPCQRCDAPRCPECGQCNCGAHVKERQCQGCFQVLTKHAFTGDAPLCDTCA